MSIEVMKQALKAFEWNHNTDLDNIPACEQWAKMLEENITSLRQAIEHAAPAQPVAWIEHIAGGVEYNPYHKAALKLPEGMRFDLYTTPPQRKPLTDEEADELIRRFARYELLRAIERAHGIGGWE